MLRDTMPSDGREAGAVSAGLNRQKAGLAENCDMTAGVFLDKDYAKVLKAKNKINNNKSYFNNTKFNFRSHIMTIYCDKCLNNFLVMLLIISIFIYYILALLLYVESLPISPYILKMCSCA